MSDETLDSLRTISDESIPSFFRQPRRHKNKNRAQDAHEAIHPPVLTKIMSRRRCLCQGRTHALRTRLEPDPCFSGKAGRLQDRYGVRGKRSSPKVLKATGKRLCLKAGSASSATAKRRNRAVQEGSDPDGKAFHRQVLHHAPAEIRRRQLHQGSGVERRGKTVYLCRHTEHPF